MNFYIASKLENHEQVNLVSSILSNKGFKHTYDWTKHGSVKNSDAETLNTVGQNEVDGVKYADIVIVLTPQVRGAYVELGVAIALGKRIYIYHENNKYFKFNDDTSSFYWVDGVKHITGSIDDLINAIVNDES